MAFTQLGHSLKIGAGGGVVIGPVDTTGAKLIVFVVTYQGVGGSVPADSMGNTWTLGAPYVQATTGNWIAIFYKLNPATSPTHTFSLFEGVTSLSVAWFSGISPSFDQGVRSFADNAVSPGSITPPRDGALFFTACSAGGGAGTIPSAIDAGFTIIDTQANNGAAFGLAQASFIQGAAAAKTPTWTGAGGFASAMLTFLEAPPSTLSASTAFGLSSTANLGVGGLSFAANTAVTFGDVADLSPGFRPPGFLLPSGYETLEDNAGASVPGGLVWSYLAGTSTPAPTYTDSTLTIVNPNPIVCDAAGRWTAWVPIGTSYKLVFETPAIPPTHGATIKTVDGLQILTLPSWTLNPYNGANFTSLGGGTWTVEAGDQVVYQYMLDGKRMFLNLSLQATTIAGVVSVVKVALPPGIVSAPWVQVGPTVIFDNSGSVMSPGYWQVDPNTAVIYFGRQDRANLAVSANATWIWFSGVIAVA